MILTTEFFFYFALKTFVFIREIRGFFSEK